MSGTGYWSTHKYKRRKVEDIQAFIGWDYLIDLCKRAETTRDKALIAALFETGGRVSEVLQLKTSHFREEDVFLLVVGMPVMKRYKKIEEYQDEDDNTRWITERQHAYRTFPIPLDEPLTPYLQNWIKHKEDRLFRISRVRVYQILHDIDPDVYPHWFRAMRASQLALEYGFGGHELVDFFNWIDLGTAFRYSRFGWKGLASKMRKK